MILMFLALGARQVLACGPFFPNWLLTDADQAALMAPQAYFEAELIRMNLVERSTNAALHSVSMGTGEADLADLTEALSRLGLSAEKTTVIVQQHRAEREKIHLADPPNSRNHYESETFLLRPNPTNNTRITADVPQITAGLPGEFADYFQGAVLWHQGELERARGSWLALLRRPEAERPFRSTWAAYMMGKSWELERPARAIPYYQEVRSLAEAGFADTLGLGVASLGREARIHYLKNRIAEAIDLYLEQWAAGDPTAALSLRLAASRALGHNPSTLAALARHPRAQRILTAYIIAGGYRKAPMDVDGVVRETALRAWSAAAQRFKTVPAPNPGFHQYQRPVTIWLEAVEKSGVKQVTAAEQLALAAYQAGDMAMAQRWLDKADDTPASQWLQAKLLLRDGKVEKAAALLAQVSRSFPEAGDQPPQTPGLIASLYVDSSYTDIAKASQQVNAEMGLFHLSRRQFTEALDALLHSTDDYWMDAAYVAERVLTLEELQQYVDRHWPAVARDEVPSDLAEKSEEDLVREAQRLSWSFSAAERVRYLLARRLARAGRFEEAQAYYPAGYDLMFARLWRAQREAANPAGPTEHRVRQLMEAALLTRRLGLELLGTEVEPDWRIHAGNFQEGVTVAGRTAQQTNLLSTSPEELDRAYQHGPEPNRRWHYRQVGARLAWQAGQLLCQSLDPKQTPLEQAQSLFDAGRFTMDHNIGWVDGRNQQEGTGTNALDVLWAQGYTAAALAWQAARLLPDNTATKARILCQGGTWIKHIDPQAADLLYKELVRRCRRTEWGAEADRLRWFPPIDAEGNLIEKPPAKP